MSVGQQLAGFLRALVALTTSVYGKKIKKEAG